MTLFAFLDIETPGLTPEPGHILEIAWMLTDETFQNVFATRGLVIDHEPDEWASIWSELRSNDYVRNMHTESGLLDAIKHGPLTSMQAAAIAFRDDVEFALNGDLSDAVENGDGVRVLPLHLAGASIHFDKDWLKVDPTFGLLFDQDVLGFSIHHRMLDFSSIKLLYASLGWDLPTEPVNPHPHRALHDVRQSLEFARSVRDQLSWLARGGNQTAEEVYG